MTIQGKITNKELSEGVGKTGKPYTRWVFHIDDKKYSTFDINIGSIFKVGDYVAIEGIQEGQYFNMKSMAKVDEPLNGPVDAQPEKIASKDQTQERICKMNCITNSLKYAELTKGDVSFKTVLDIAQDLFRYVW